MVSLLWAQALQFQSQILREAWALLALVPLGILLLYFLKLKRRSVQVPSTLLWRKSLEDMQVNSPFQKLRKNLLLLLQLLAVGFAMLALAGPRSQGVDHGKRLVIAIDESASMGATDVQPNRLDQAILKACKLIEDMRTGDLAMIVAFSNTARVVTSYTEDKSLLLERLKSMKPSENSTSLKEALQLVSGLANPQKYMDPGEGVEVVAFTPPRLFLFTDGGFSDVENFSLGSIEPEVVPIGPPVDWSGIAGSQRGEVGDTASAISTTDSEPEARLTAATSAAFTGPASDNLAILSLSTARDEGRPDQLQIFGRVRNHRAEAVQTRALLYRHDPEQPGDSPSLIDAIALEVPTRTDQAFQFELKAESLDGEFSVRLEADDAQPLDNVAFAVSVPPHRARVLVVTNGDRFLADTLTTPASQQIAEVTSIRPEELDQPERERSLQDGSFDMIIFEGVRPKVQPEANVLYLGSLPPDVPENEGKAVTGPAIIDWEMAHPILQYVRDLGSVAIRKGFVIDLPTGSTQLIESDQGVLGYVRGRGAFQDVVLGFSLMDGKEFNTNWTLKSGFPLFVFNCLRVLGNASESGGSERDSFTTDSPISLRIDTLAEEVEIQGPTGSQLETCQRSSQGTFQVAQARKTGIYHAKWGNTPGQSLPFAVNLFNERESNLAPRGQVPPGLTEAQADTYRIKIGSTPVQSRVAEAPVTREWWWIVTLVTLGIVIFEWFIYNRRVYI